MDNSISRCMGTRFKADLKNICSEVKIPESTLNQEVEVNYQFEVQDHIYDQVQFHEMDNLPKCQYGSRNFDVCQVQKGVLKLILGFQNNIVPGLNR